MTAGEIQYREGADLSVNHSKKKKKVPEKGVKVKYLGAPLRVTEYFKGAASDSG